MWRLLKRWDKIPTWNCSTCLDIEGGPAEMTDEYYCMDCGKVPHHLKVVWDQRARREEVFIWTGRKRGRRMNVNPDTEVLQDR